MKVGTRNYYIGLGYAPLFKSWVATVKLGIRGFIWDSKMPYWRRHKSL